MHKITNNLVNYHNDNFKKKKKIPLMAKILKGKLIKKTMLFVIHDTITQLLQVKAALQQATHERFSSRPHDGKI